MEVNVAYTNIISRKLNYECINLGFSGNGQDPGWKNLKLPSIIDS